MIGRSILDDNRQIVVTGVEGAGRRSFASLYFPNENPVETTIRLSRKVKELLVVVMLDCLHLQNLAEADVLQELSEVIKRKKIKTVRLLLVLSRIDLVCSWRQNRAWLEAVMREYRPYLKMIKAKDRKIIAHSNLAVQWLRNAMNGEIDAEDIDDLRYFFAKAGWRLPRFVSKNNVREYLSSHIKTFQMLSGEYYAKGFLKVKK